MKQKIESWIRRWEKRGYQDGIPDEACPYLEAAGKVPSYRRICLAIMRNDMALTSLGFTREPCEAYMMLKKIEIANRRTNERA